MVGLQTPCITVTQWRRQTLGRPCTVSGTEEWVTNCATAWLSVHDMSRRYHVHMEHNSAGRQLYPIQGRLR